MLKIQVGEGVREREREREKKKRRTFCKKQENAWGGKENSSSEATEPAGGLAYVA